MVRLAGDKIDHIRLEQGCVSKGQVEVGLTLSMLNKLRCHTYF